MKIRIALLSCLLAAAAFAADISGKWTYEQQGRNGAMTVTMTLKADGSNLTGSISGRNGDTAINNGKIDGDKFSFDVTRQMGDNSVTIKYSGTVAGDELKMSVDAGRGQPREVTAKRASGT